jgi:hypothetical protein
MSFKQKYRLRATLKTGRYHVAEGKSLENLKKKGRQLENEGAIGYVEHMGNNRVMFQFGTLEAQQSKRSTAMSPAFAAPYGKQEADHAQTTA